MSNQPSDRSIGKIIAETNNLSSDQVDAVLAYQTQHGGKFGEAAVQLGYVKREDVLWALSQQFHYPYTQQDRGRISAELVAATSPFNASAEFFRDVRSQLLSGVMNPERSRRPLAITSPDSGDGKTYFAANLAVAFSQLGSRTLLIDADMRTPRLHDLFGIESSSGLSGILSGRAETNVIRPIDDLPSLYILPVGTVPPNPLELVQRSSFEMLLGELVKKFEYVIVDTPAMSHGADARVIAAKCGCSLVVGRRGVTQMKSLQGLLDALKKQKEGFAGMILNEF